MKKKLATTLSVVLILGLATLGILAYLTDSDSDVNVMTLGNVDIEQIEQERGDNGLQDFTGNNGESGKPLFPATPGFDQNLNSDGLWHTENNAVDKIVSVKNTGESTAYVRTWFAFETAGVDSNKILTNCNTKDWEWAWIGKEMIDGIEYNLAVATYKNPLPSGNTTPDSLLQVALHSDATNEDVAAFGEDYKVLVVSQGVQTQGFATADAALTAGFGEAIVANHPFEGIGDLKKVAVTPANIEQIDFTEENMAFTFSGDFEAITIEELGDGSTLEFDDATVGAMTLADDATISGEATIESVNVVRNNTEAIEITLYDATLDVENEVNVKNASGKSILNINNSKLNAATIYVGGHTQNEPDALAEFNVINSYISCEENSLGSTISVWGRSGVKSVITDSEIYTYSRGWHQSEDANDNSITFQGGKNIDVKIENSNMHLYGARSIINARKYGNDETNVNFTVDESLIWVVTKSSHGETTLPVWGATDINDSMLLFTKNVHQSTPAVFKSFVYGNPVVHGDYSVTTQCQWDAPIVLDNQTVTFAKDANVSIYDGAGKVGFECNNNAKVVLESGATVTNIYGIN